MPRGRDGPVGALLGRAPVPDHFATLRDYTDARRPARPDRLLRPGVAARGHLSKSDLPVSWTMLEYCGLFLGGFIAGGVVVLWFVGRAVSDIIARHTGWK